jgi:two-component system LytT family response regulator
MNSPRNNIRALIVDDEKPARHLIAQLLVDYPDVDVVGECADGREAVAAIRATQPDLIFLDIRMPQMDGFAVLEELDLPNPPVVIFVTAYDEYAVKAFEFHALDYLLKPFRRERLTAAIGRARQTLSSPQRQLLRPRLRALLEYWRHDQPLPEADSRYLQRIFVKTGGQSLSIDVPAIDWVRSVDHFVEIHSHGKSHLLYSTISALELKLDPEKFLRIHRTTIINLTAVREFRLEDSGACVAVIKDGSEHRVSRNRRELLRDRVKTL